MHVATTSHTDRSPAISIDATGNSSSDWTFGK
jgi:hypothetical protein